MDTSDESGNFGLEDVLEALTDLARVGAIRIRDSVPFDEGSSAAMGAAATATSGGLDLNDYIHKRASESLQAAGDALHALCRVVQPPPLLTSPGGVAREILESSVMCLWLTEAGCAVEIRLERAARLLFNDLKEMRKLSEVNSPSDSENSRAASEDDSARVMEQMAQVREHLRLKGIPEKGIPATLLSRTMVDAEWEYRLWSNLSHGNPYALQEFRRAHSEPQHAAATLMHFITVSTDAYSRALVSYVEFCRPSVLVDLKNQLRYLYDRIGMADGETRDFIQ